MNRKKVLAVFLIFVMIVAVNPFSALADSSYFNKSGEFDASTKENVDAVDLYVDEISDLISESVHEITEEPVAGNESARGVLNDGNRNISLEKAFERSQASSLQSAAAAAEVPSLFVTSMTPNSVTFSVTFPISGRWGNVVALDNHNVAQPYLYNNIDPWNNSYYMVNGTYTIPGLVPGGFYYLKMMWSTDGSYYGGSNVLYCGFQLPYNTTEELVRTDGTYVYTEVESADKSLSTVLNFSTWLNRLDQTYIALRDLTGFTPYSGNKIGVKSSRQMSSSDYVNGNNYWSLTYAYAGYAGYPATYFRPFYRSLMQRLGSNDWSRTAIHEISHGFDKNAWEFDSEVLADFKTYYVVETLGARVYLEDAEKYYTGSAFSEYFKTDHRLWSYSRNFTFGNYTPYGMVWLLINIKNQIGWQPFKDTFRYLGTLSNSSISNINKFNLFMTKLKDYSGYDVLTKLSANDKLVIGNRLGGLVNYITGDSYEPNNSTAQATSIANNTTITNANIHLPSDVDYYKFTLNGNYNVTINLSNIPSSCDYDLRLYNSSGTLLTASLLGSNQSETISVLLSTGTYYVMVYSYSGSSDSYYRLQLTSTVAKTTLVLIPGGMGSRLYYNGSKKWDPTRSEVTSGTFENSMKSYLLSNENGIPNYTLSYTRAANDYGAQDAYMTIYNYLTNTGYFPASQYNVKFFTYDWRLSSAEIANKLANELANDSKVILIAHSMGGLIASSYLAKGQSYRDKVDKLITFGTPYTGAAKAINAFETGQLFGWVNDLFMSGHMKDISVNTTSAYELLPTSRYGDSYLGIIDPLYWSQTNYSHSAARTFLTTRPWAKKANGSVKPMLASAEAFHNSLMINSTHVAEYFVKSYYIYGTGRATPSQALYANDNNTYLSYLEPSVGDGTVIAKSARNNRAENAANTKLVYSEHKDLVSDTDALAYMKSIITGAPYYSASLVSNNGLSSEKEIIDEEDGIDCISVVIQGVQNLKILDADGSEMVQDGDTIYRQKSDGSLTEIGSIWLLDTERQRYQYVLDPGEYQFEDIELDSSIKSEVLVMSFENDRYLSKILYDSITPNEIQIDVSFGESTLIEKSTMGEIVPSQIATAKEIQELNARKESSN